MYKLKMRMSKKKFENLITKEANDILDDYLYAARNHIQIDLYNRITELLKNTDVWRDFLSHGPLWKKLGAADLVSNLELIIQHWASSLDTKDIAIPSNGTMNRGVRFLLIKADYSDVLQLDEASFTSITQREGPYKGTEHKIEWLRWLLLEGRQYVVKDYVFTPKIRGQRGGGLMIPKKGAGWRVPQEYAGTVDDNFLTRALDAELDGIIDDINRVIGRL